MTIARYITRTKQRIIKSLLFAITVLILPLPLFSSTASATKHTMHITMLNTGNGPKKEVLRYNLIPYQKETLKFSKQFSKDSAYLGFANHETHFVIEVDTHVASIQSDNSATINFHFRHLKTTYKKNLFSSKKLKEMHDILNYLQGVQGTYIIQPNGQVSHITLKHSERYSPTVKKNIKMLILFVKQSIIFPKQKVGLGARWKVTQTLTSHDGTTGKQTVLFTLLKRTDNQLMLSTQVTQEFDLSAIQWWLRAYSTHGNGKLHITTNSLIPSSTANIEAKSKVTSGRLKQTISLTQVAKIHSEKVPAKGSVK